MIFEGVLNEELRIAILSYIADKQEEYQDHFDVADVLEDIANFIEQL